jgi:hypothetical protein
VLPPRTPLLRGEHPRIYLAGDSTMLALAMKLGPYGQRKYGFIVLNGGAFACHIVRGGTYRWAALPPKPTEPICNGWEETRMQELAQMRPHVTIVGFGVADLLDRQLPGSAAWQHLGEPAYDALARRELETFAAMLERSGTRTIWLTTPVMRFGVIDGVPPLHDFPESDPARAERWNELIADTVAHHPTIHLVDLRAWLRSQVTDELDPSARPDGIHFDDHFLRLEARWLAPQVMAAAVDAPA